MLFQWGKLSNWCSYASCSPPAAGCTHYLFSRTASGKQLLGSPELRPVLVLLTWLVLQTPGLHTADSSAAFSLPVWIRNVDVHSLGNWCSVGGKVWWGHGSKYRKRYYLMLYLWIWTFRQSFGVPESISSGTGLPDWWNLTPHTVFAVYPMPWYKIRACLMF